MLLLFLYPGTIRVASCWASFQLISSVAAPSRSSTAGVVPLSTLSTTAPMPSSTGDPALSCSRSGSRRISSPWATSRCARPWTPCLAAHDAVADRQAQVRWPCRPPPAQAVQLAPSRSRSQTPANSTIAAGAAKNPPGNCFSPTPRGGFCMPGPAASSQPPQRRYTQLHWKPPVRINLWPRPLFSRG